MRGSAVSGATLIIVIFIMLLFGVLGWSLAVMQAGMYESSLRAIAPDQALNLAEAGARWGINEFIINSTMSSSDDACDSAAEWVTHTLYPGQYQVCTRSPQAAESGSVVVESIGYVPDVAAYQAKRRVKIMASVGSFDRSMIVRDLFNWNDSISSQSFINGSMLCMYYEHNKNGVYNEEGLDYSNNAADLLPRSNRLRPGANPPRRDVGQSIFPEINMAFYETDPKATVLAQDYSGTIENITRAGGYSSVRMARANFFGDSSLWPKWRGHALRNISRGPWKTGNWKEIDHIESDGRTAVLNGEVDWLEGERAVMEPRIGTTPVFTEVGRTRTYTYSFTVNGTFNWPVGQAVRNFSRGGWNYTDWGEVVASSSANNVTSVKILMDGSVQSEPSPPWRVGDWVGFVRRLTEDDCEWRSNGLLFNHNVLYVQSDVLFDTRPGNINTHRTGVVCEGDAVIRGVNGITLEKKPLLYPNLATKYGNIYSPDTPSGNNYNQRLSKRNFDDIIFTEYGDIYFNYVDCMAMYGSNVTLAGVFQMRYDPDLTKLTGYAFGVSGMNWQEE
ncbi:MAG TPA: hypothetical protein PLJ26_06670 [Candidatus Omnitrophota bacterium]|nr:hypothetical protein [Candidatus Omnitrophota bacterium]